MWSAIPNTRIELFHSRYVIPKALAPGGKQTNKQHTHTHKNPKQNKTKKQQVKEREINYPVGKMAKYLNTIKAMQKQA